MKESKFQHDLIKEIKETFPGSIVIKNDSSYIQGFPDLTILYKNKWACLEVKNNAKAGHQPNQDWYVDELNKMSFSSFVFPENKEKVMYELQQTFELGRKACGSESE